jgi:hypothetical protein
MHPNPLSLSRIFRPYPSHCPLPTDHCFPLALTCRRIYRAAMRNAVHRGPAETDCPRPGLGKTGGEALPLVTSPGLVGFRGTSRLGCHRHPMMIQQFQALPMKPEPDLRPIFTLGTALRWGIFTLDLGAECSNELNSPLAVSASVDCGVADPGGLFASCHANRNSH